MGTSPSLATADDPCHFGKLTLPGLEAVSSSASEGKVLRDSVISSGAESGASHVWTADPLFELLVTRWPSLLEDERARILGVLDETRHLNGSI